MTVEQNTAIDAKVLRSARRAETYLYLRADVNYDDLPDGLREHFGEASEFLQFALTESRVLAQADTRKVMQALREQGFYLQLPPPKVLPSAAG